MSSEEQYYLGNELLGWGPDQGVLSSLQVLWSPAVISFSGRLRMTGNFCLLPSHFLFPCPLFTVTWVQEEMVPHISVWCVLVSGVFVVYWSPLVCHFIDRVARFSSCLFWLASQHSGVVLSNRTSCNVSVCASGLPMEVAPGPPHVTSVIEETFLIRISCILKLIHL